MTKNHSSYKMLLKEAWERKCLSLQTLGHDVWYFDHQSFFDEFMQRKKEEITRLRGWRDQIKFIDLKDGRLYVSGKQEEV